MDRIYAIWKLITLVLDECGIQFIDRRAVRDLSSGVVYYTAFEVGRRSGEMLFILSASSLMGGMLAGR